MQANNMKLLAQHTMNGHGGMGEGMSLQLARRQGAGHTQSTRA